MKTLLIATLLAATTFAASAQSGSGEAYGQNSPTFVSQKSRAEVIAELRAAQESGSIASGEAYGQNSPTFVSQKSRAEVIAELRAAQHAGSIAYGEQSQESVSAPTTSALTRQQVLQDAAGKAPAYYGELASPLL